MSWGKTGPILKLLVNPVNGLLYICLIESQRLGLRIVRHNSQGLLLRRCGNSAEVTEQALKEAGFLNA